MHDKLDRLARNVAFVSALMEAGVEFEAVDFPQANRLTIHILAAVAEHEAKVISERTKAALAAAKRRGVQLGGFRAGAKLTAKARQAGCATVQRSPMRRRPGRWRARQAVQPAPQSRARRRSPAPARAGYASLRRHQS
jgi:DNA invertase Pin-like site-specific DNA recombinase